MGAMVIGVDVDGVLANFNKAYRQRLIKITGRALIPEGEDPPCWNYAPHYGYTKEEDSRVWESIKEDRDFWRGLEALPGARALLFALQDVQFYRDAEIYFITSRPGATAKEQTERWLEAHGFIDPTVLIARGEKGFFAQGLRLTHFLDDKPENCYSVKQASPKTHNYLLSARYNEAQHDEAREQGIVVIRTLAEFAEFALVAKTH
jgi:5'(3')-deoxyribonucleotidase